MDDEISPQLLLWPRRVARHVQKSYLSPKVGQLRSVKASKFVVVELLNVSS